MSDPCDCDKQFVNYFAKLHAISHSIGPNGCHLKCLLCETDITGFQTIERHLSSELHQKRQKQLIYYLFLLSIPSSSPIHSANISDILIDNYQKCSLNESDCQQRQEAVKEINELIQRNGLNDHFVQLYGSTINGFGLKESDLNLYVVCNRSDRKSKLSVLSMAQILPKISEIIERSDQFSDIESDFIGKWRTICMTFKPNKYKIRITITDGHQWYRSAKLLNTYCQIDNRVSVLGTLFREWARIEGFDRQPNHLWPPFVYPLLAIHFLQKCCPPVIPTLDSKLFDNKSPMNENVSEDHFDVRSLNWRKQNHKNIGELWLEMLRFYCLEFEAKTIVLSLTSNGLHIGHKLFAKLTKDSILDLNPLIIRQISQTFRVSAIPFITRNSNPLAKPKPLFTERHFEIIVIQNEDKENENPVLTEISLFCAEEFGQNSNKDKDLPFFPNKVKEILEIFDIRLKLDSYLMQKMNSKTYQRFSFDFCLNRFSFFPQNVCRICDEIDFSLIYDLPALTSLTTPFSPISVELLNKVCLNIYETKRRTKSDESLQTFILNDLQTIIRENLIPNACLKVYGSAANGFGAHDSDLDICLQIDGNESGDGIVVDRVIDNIAVMLKSYKKFVNIKPIIWAKIPIVRFDYKLNEDNDRNDDQHWAEPPVSCDISLCNGLGLYNTSLLKCYSNIDSRVTELGLVVKHFVKSRDLCDASRKRLSSYAYCLLTIHYLQQKGIIPVLQEIGLNEKVDRLVDGWNVWFFNDLNCLDQYWRPEPNKESVGQLFLGFLRYYTEEFDFNKYVVCCRQLTLLSKVEKHWIWDRIAIEDPFRLEHNLGSVLSPQMAEHIIRSLILTRNQTSILGNTNSMDRISEDNLHNIFFNNLSDNPLVNSTHQIVL